VGKLRYNAFVRRSEISGPPRPELTPAQSAKLKFERFFDFLRENDEARLLKDIMAGGSRG